MSPNRWILLLIFYISYLMFGAAIYYHIEHGEEKLARAAEMKEQVDINEYLLDELSDKNKTVQNEILERISDYCGKPVTLPTQNDTPYTWTFYHAFFFAFTVCSTVGYGNISPTTFAGRMIMIAYSVIGIPVNGILFAGLGEYFGRTFEAIYRRYKKYKMSSDMHYVPPQLGLITTVVIALIPGIALFLLLPSWVFTYFEDWPYSISLYYSYVTTTTIGFGDYVPTFGANQPREFGGWFVVYQIFVIVWFIFSLGYLVMIMTFITRGLQSKKLAYLEQQLSSNLKATQNRIWTGVTKDVGYLRRMLNELYILKVKFCRKGNRKKSKNKAKTEQKKKSGRNFAYTMPRSNSCPDLSMYRIEPAPIPSRKRAFSLCADLVAAQRDAGILVHASSDTELSKLDREKTFETAEAYRQTTDLLAKVVSALATVKPPPAEQEDAALYGGYHGFSDSQILASEWSFSTVNEFTTPRRPRARACSDFNLEAPRWQSERPLRSSHNEWTWSGDNQQIQEAFNQRYKGQQQRSNGVVNSTMVHLEPDALEEQLKKPSPPGAGRAKKFSMPDGLRRLFPFQKKRPSQDLERKLSVVSVPEGVISQQARSPMDYYSNTVTAASSQFYMRNGRGPPPPFESNGSLASAGGLTNLGFQLEDGATPPSALGGGAYQRRVAAGKRRRESIYTQNQAPSARRGSMYPPTAHALAQMQMRRGSLANSGSGSAAMAAVAARRGSLFPATASASSMTSAPRRSSIFSVTSDKDMNVLEQTTIADLIRALEVVHTHAVLDEQQQAAAAAGGAGGGGTSKGSRKQRKMGNAGLDPPQLPPILSLFAGDQTRTLQAAAANRLYARRSTIVGISPTGGAAGPTARSLLEPPPSYTERAGSQSQLTAGNNVSGPSANASTTGQSKFRRRFSVRPTALQIPPGQAPPPGANLMDQSSQSALQRRLSLRPSPLARELSPTSPPGGSSAAALGAATEESGGTSAQRLLPLPAATRPSTSSTHSPLSRIVQISQAQRKSSMPSTAAGSGSGSGAGGSTGSTSEK
ncbi:open rectifier potassium channel protein 1 isoform X4 [Drosophila suzukii]|uniref:Open rectifier potassium channel protein 1 isoform X4 n=1 Tax=Drosophila suzukii TaxID=28584 RepID=A0AB40AEG7_DROSZ